MRDSVDSRSSADSLISVGSALLVMETDGMTELVKGRSVVNAAIQGETHLVASMPITHHRVASWWGNDSKSVYRFPPIRTSHAKNSNHHLTQTKRLMQLSSNFAWGVFLT